MIYFFLSENRPVEVVVVVAAVVAVVVAVVDVVVLAVANSLSNQRPRVTEIFFPKKVSNCS